MISNSTSVSLVTEEKLFPMTLKTRQLFFSLFFPAWRENFDQTFPTTNEKFPEAWH